MADKTDKQDALRRMREEEPARIGPFRVGMKVTGGPFGPKGSKGGKIVATVPDLRDKIKMIDPKKKRRAVDAKRKGKAT